MAATQDRTLGIYIKGVDEETTEEDCTAAFSSFGTITEVVLKGERGWGLVHFTTPAEAAAAAAGGITSVGGVEVEVLARTPPKPREDKAVPASVNIYLKGLEEETTREEVETALEAFGEVASVKLQAARGFAFAAMETVEAAEAAVAATPLTVGALGDVEVEMRRSRAPAPRNGSDKPRSKKKSEPRPPRDLSKDIYIKGLTPETDEDSNEDALMDVFGQYGTVTRVMLRKGRDFAFISFEEDGAVAAAVAASGNIDVKGATVDVEARTGKPRDGVAQ